MSLINKAIDGVVWTVVDTFVLKGLSFLATIVLARWMGPEQFGIVGMVAIFIAIGNSLTDSGLSASLIRTKYADDKDFSTVFVLNFALSVSTYLLVYFSAPYIAIFFNQQILIDVLRLYCLSFVISGLSAVQLVKLQMDMNFKKIAKLNVIGIIIGVSVGLVLGYYDYGVWAIVLMHLTIQTIQACSLWISSDWKPSIKYYKDKAKFHYGFGYKLMLSGLLNTIFQNIYNILIGRYYPSSVLGFYERSKSLNDYPVTIITSVVSKVTYPLLSSIQDDKMQLSSVYRKILTLTFFITAPMMLTALALAEPLFLEVLGAEWEPAIVFFQVLCLSSIFYPIHAFNLNVFKVYGRSDLFLKLEIIKKTIIVISVLIMSQFGVYGLVWSSVFTSLIALIINTYYCAELINYSGKQQFLDMFPILVTAILSSAIIYIMNYYLLLFSGNIIKIICGLIVGIVTYVIMNYMLKSLPLEFLWKLIKKKIV